MFPPKRFGSKPSGVYPQGPLEGLGIGTTTLGQPIAVRIMDGRMLRNWWSILVPLAVAISGYLLRSGFSIPPLYGSWLASATMQLLGVDQTSYLGVPYIEAWSFIAFAGLGASLLVRSLNPAEVPSSWRHLISTSQMLLPAIVATALPWFAWPLNLLLPVFVIAVPLLSIASLVSLALLLSRRCPFFSEGIRASCRAISWSLLALVLMDWANLLLIGGS